MESLQVYNAAEVDSADYSEIEEIENGIRRCMFSILEDSIRIGQYLQRARKLFGHGEFLPWLEGIMSKQRASECQWLAEAYSDPDSDVYHFLHDAGIKSKSQALAVRSLPQQVIADSLMLGRLGDVPLSKIGELPVKQLKLKLRDVKQAVSAPAPNTGQRTTLEDTLSGPTEAEQILAGLLIEMGRAAQKLKEHPPLSKDIAQLHVNRINQTAASIINTIRPHYEVEVEPFEDPK